MAHRKPSIAKARDLLGWRPRIGLDAALERTLYSYLEGLRPAPRQARKAPPNPIGARRTG